MKTLKIVLGVLTVVFIVVLTATSPKREQPIPLYNPATEVRTQGVVQEVQEFYCPISDDQGIHLKLQTDHGILLVHVAPARFLRSQMIRFNNGDQVEVLGSRVEYQGVDGLLAREISRGEEVIILRDHLGQPVWQ